MSPPPVAGLSFGRRSCSSAASATVPPIRRNGTSGTASSRTAPSACGTRQAGGSPGPRRARSLIGTSPRCRRTRRPGRAPRSCTSGDWPPPASSKHPDEAWTLIKAWTAHDVQLVAAEVGSQHPTRPSAIQPYWDQHPTGHPLNVRPFTAQIPVAKTFPHLDNPLLDQAFQQLLNDAWAKVLTQDTSIPQFVDGLSPLVGEILKRQ